VVASLYHPSLIAGYLSQQLDFEDATGMYQIQDSARVPENALNFGVYVLRQASGRFTYEVILQDRTVDGRCVLEEPIDDLTLGKGSFIFGMTMAGISVSLSLGSAIFLFRNRFNPTIAMGQPLFLYFSCFGSSLFAFSSFFMSFDDFNLQNMGTLDTFCMLQIWMGYMPVR
jgi:hypothetical protein